MSNSLQMGTRAVWAGEEEYLMQGATQVPIVHRGFAYRFRTGVTSVCLVAKDRMLGSRIVGAEVFGNRVICGR
jgi:cystathionine gamma-synthase